MNTPYNLSTNYDILFNLICEGKVIAAFCGSDICKVIRYGEYDIKITARGTLYNGVCKYHREDGQERDVFKQKCETIDLKWIQP